jgi:hypothetical protein
VPPNLRMTQRTHFQGYWCGTSVLNVRVGGIARFSRGADGRREIFLDLGQRRGSGRLIETQLTEGQIASCGTKYSCFELVIRRCSSQNNKGPDVVPSL